MRFKVEFLINSTYQVYRMPAEYDINDDFEPEMVFQGDIAECEAYIRLKEGGYMND